jgi:hypothetical protein
VLFGRLAFLLEGLFSLFFPFAHAHALSCISLASGWICCCSSSLGDGNERGAGLFLSRLVGLCCFALAGVFFFFLHFSAENVRLCVCGMRPLLRYRRRS